MLVLSGLAVTAVLCSCVGCRAPDPIARSQELVARGRADEAIALLRRAIDEDPTDDGLQFAYARALAAGGMRALAEWPLRRAMRVEEWRRPAGLALAENAMTMRNVDVAIEVLSSLLEDDPRDVDVLLRRASAHAAARTNLDEALDDVARVRGLAPDDLRAYQPEIQAYLHAAMTEEAGTAIAELGDRLEETGRIEDGETERWYCVTRALFEQESRRFSEAEALWEECLRRSPISLEVVSESAAFFEARGKPERAREILATAVEGTDLADGLVFRIALAERLRALGETDRGLELLREGTEAPLAETALAYWRTLATYHESASQTDRALDARLRVIALATRLGLDADEERFAAADLAIRAGDLREASDLARRVRAPSYRGLLEARIAHDRGDLELAIERYEETARLWPDNPYLRYHEARAMERLGALDQAIELYRHTTRIDEAATDAQTRIALILESEDRVRDALSVLSMQASRAPLDVESEIVLARLLGRALPAHQLGGRIAEWRKRQPAAIIEGLTAFAQGLRGRGEPGAALSLLDLVDADALPAHPAAPAFVRELVRSERELGKPSAKLDRLIQGGLAHEAIAADWLAVAGHRAELAGDDQKAVALYDRALATRPTHAAARAGRARIRALDAPDGAFAVATAMLEEARAEREVDEVFSIARALARAGHADAALRLYARLFDRRPWDVDATRVLCETSTDGPFSPALRSRLPSVARRAQRLGRSCPAADELAEAEPRPSAA